MDYLSVSRVLIILLTIAVLVQTFWRARTAAVASIQKMHPNGQNNQAGKHSRSASRRQAS